MALLAAGTVLYHLRGEDRHQPRAPSHRLPEHGRPRRSRAGGKEEDAVRERSE